MPRRKRVPATPEQTRDWLKKAVHSAPRPLPPGFFPRILEQSEREEVMLNFRNGKIDLLVATDIVARGIDVDDIPLVINYDVPHDAEDYVHRIGRTARGGSGSADAEEGPQGKSGEAITLVSEKDQHYFGRIEAFLEYEVEKLPLPEGFEPAPAYEPRKKKSAKKPRSKSHKQSHKSHQSTPSGNTQPKPEATTLKKGKQSSRTGKKMHKHSLQN